MKEAAKLVRALILGLGLQSAAFGGNDSGTYRFVAHYSKGEQHRYSILTAISGMVENNSRALGIESAVRYEVIRTLPGATKIRLTYDRLKSGNLNVPIVLKPSTIFLDKHNQPIKGSQTAQMFVIFPSHPVKIGDKWDGTYSFVLSGTSGALVDVTYKLDGVKKDRNRNIAVLSMNLRGVAPGEGTVLVDLKDGSVLSSVLNVTIRDRKANKSFPVQILLKRQN